MLETFVPSQASLVLAVVEGACGESTGADDRCLRGSPTAVLRGRAERARAVWSAARAMVTKALRFAILGNVFLAVLFA